MDGEEESRSLKSESHVYLYTSCLEKEEDKVNGAPVLSPFWLFVREGTDIAY